MQADIAANSDSTIRYSHGSSSPVRTRSERRLDDVGLRRDRIGGDHLGPAQRHRLGDRLGALELLKHERGSPISLRTYSNAASAAGDVAARRACRELARESPRRPTRSRPAPLSAAKPPSSDGVGQRAPEVLAGDLGGRHGEQRARGESRSTNSPRPSSSKLRAVLIRM